MTNEYKIQIKKAQKTKKRHARRMQILALNKMPEVHAEITMAAEQPVIQQATVESSAIKKLTGAIKRVWNRKV